MSQIASSCKSDDLTRVCAFSLATALAWLGHDCAGGCPPSLTRARSNVWFARRAEGSLDNWADTLVAVEFGETLPLAVLDALLARVNRCVRGDHIRVCARTPHCAEDFQLEPADGRARESAAMNR